MNISTWQIIEIVLMIIAFIPAIVLHECAHAYAAYKLGDPTAKRAGRLTLNPIKHVDPFGSILLPAVLILGSSLAGGSGIVFGYAKPVPYNPNYFKDIRKGELIVGLAGPAANLVMAVIGAIIAYLASYLYIVSPTAAVYVCYFGQYFCTLNLCLCFFNIIPLPPLDGSSIIALFLSNKGLQTYYRIQQYSMWILIIVVIILPYLTGIDIIGGYLQLTAGNLANLLLSF